MKKLFKRVLSFTTALVITLGSIQLPPFVMQVHATQNKMTPAHEIFKSSNLDGNTIWYSDYDDYIDDSGIVEYIEGISPGSLTLADLIPELDEKVKYACNWGDWSASDKANWSTPDISDAGSYKVLGADFSWCYNYTQHNEALGAIAVYVIGEVGGVPCTGTYGVTFTYSSDDEIKVYYKLDTMDNSINFKRVKCLSYDGYDSPYLYSDGSSDEDTTFSYQSQDMPYEDLLYMLYPGDLASEYADTTEIGHKWDMIASNVFQVNVVGGNQGGGDQKVVLSLSVDDSKMPNFLKSPTAIEGENVYIVGGAREDGYYPSQADTKQSDALDHLQDYYVQAVAAHYQNLENAAGYTPLAVIFRALSKGFDTVVTGNNLSKEFPEESFDRYHMMIYILNQSLEAVNSNMSAIATTYTFTNKDDTTKQCIVNLKQSNGGYIVESFEGDAPPEMTGYQEDSLKTTYTYLYINRTGINYSQGPLLYDYLLEDVVQNGTGKLKNEGSLTTSPVSEDDLRDAIEEFESYTYTPSAQGVIDIARFASVLTKYTLYHSINTNLSETDPETGRTYIEGMSGLYNASLQGLLESWGVFKTYEEQITDGANDPEESGNSLAYCYMPSKIGAFSSGTGNLSNDAINGSMGFNNIQEILYAESYVFKALNDTGFGIENGYPYEAIKEVLDDPENASSNSSSPYATVYQYLQFLIDCHGATQFDAEMLAKVEVTDDINIWVFRAIIELHDVIQLLDIDPKSWSPEVEGYYNLYMEHPDVFEALRKNPYIMGLGFTGGNTIDNPLGIFFSVESGETSEYWNIGFATSALYVPMITNLYDASTYDFAIQQDDTWLGEFFYKYGFHRKALYISTDPNIVVNSKLSKTSDNGKKVATLQDLLNYNRDIQLYIDTRFYNADTIEGAIGRVDYATLYQYMHTQQTTVNVTDEAALNQLQADSGTTNQIYKDDQKNFIDETLNLDTDTLLKSGEVVSYSIDIAKDVTKLGDTPDVEKESLYDGYVLSADAICGKENVFMLYDYTPMMGYAVVSAIYRDVKIYNELAKISQSSKTVFESSRNILFVDKASKTNWLSYMNYLQLANLESQMNKNVETQLDLNSPIFIDIFGNICTESGFVIIPAAANATLCGNNWTPYTIGFGTYLSAGGYDIDISDLPKDVISWLTDTPIIDDTTDEEVDTVDVDKLGNGSHGGWFVYTRKGELQLKNAYVQSYGLIASVNWGTLNANSNVIRQVFWNNAYFVKARKIYSTRMLNTIVEVLRGAPVENINYEKEKLEGVESSSAGIVIAYALDKLLQSISTTDTDFVNSMTTMPNVVFMPYLKYIIYFAVKITIALLILLFIIRLFMNGVRNKFGFKEVVAFCFTIIVVVSAIYILPNSITWSYDKANSVVLATEAEDMLLYSILRSSEGQEIGITDVHQIDECTQLLVEVDKVYPSWSMIFGKALLSNDYDSFTDLFDDALKDTPYYGMNGVVQKGPNVYIDIQTVIDSTSIAYSKSRNCLYNKNVIRDEQAYYSYNRVENPVGDTDDLHETYTYEKVEEDAGDGSGMVTQDYYAVYSFASPYYVILDQLIANVNEYNNQHNVQTYTATVDAKGKVMTYDVAVPYLLSDEFLEDGYDILGLTDILQCETTLPKYTYIFDEEDKQNVKYSAWYPDNIDEPTRQERIKEVYDYARAFVSEHKTVMKHIPDELMLKTLAFACSVKYNQVFHCQYADSIKLITVDNRDIMRFMLGDFNDVYSNYAYTFGRYVYRTTGTVGVILSAVLCVVVLITTVLKPLLVMILFALIIINICFRELLFDKPNQGVEGYFIGCALFMFVNFIYAGGLKICFLIANSNLSAVAAMIMCICMQILYLVAVAWLVYTQVSDWKNVGFTHYAAGAGLLFGGIGGVLSRDRSPITSRGNTRDSRAERLNGGVTVTTQPSKDPQKVVITDEKTPRNRQVFNGNRTRDDMYERDEERETSPYRHY